MIYLETITQRIKFRVSKIKNKFFKHIPFKYYILDEDYNLAVLMKGKLTKEVLLMELERIKDGEVYFIKQINEEEIIDVGYDERCLNQMMDLIRIGDLVSHEREKYPNGKHHHLFEFKFSNGLKVRWDLYEQELLHDKEAISHVKANRLVG